MTSADNGRFAARRRTHEAISQRLTGLSDVDMAELAPEGGWRAHFHGGHSGLVEVDGSKVFAKHIALTDLERAAEGSTANLFGLPGFYQYGIGSAGFGAWRELAAVTRASEWALAGDCPYFPIIHHWRVVSRPQVELSERQQNWVTLAPDYWDGSQAVRARVEAIAAATSSIVMFMEPASWMLSTWLTERIGGSGRVDDETAKLALRFRDQLETAAAFMNGRGMLHFDLHMENVLTDGEQIYIADFGLAVCEDFDLDEDEQAFVAAHRLYDRAYVDRAFRQWVAPREGDRPGLTPALEAEVARRAPSAAVLEAFLSDLRENKRAAYPEAEVAAAFGA